MTTSISVGPGSRGPLVARVQRRLTELGFAPGAADGIYGPRTAAALLAWQIANGVSETVVEGGDGKHPSATRETFRKMFGGSPNLEGMNAISRLIAQNGRGRYVLGAGGTNPNQATPFTWKGAQYGSDCIGAVCWALGIPRHDDNFPEYEGDINVDSSLMDAGLLEGGKGGRKFFEPAESVVPGVLVAYPSIRARELWPGKEAEHGFKPTSRVRIGHIGIVMGWDGLADPFHIADHPWDGQPSSLVTIECRASWPAVRMGRNQSFLDGTHYSRKGESWTNEKWGVQFMQFTGGRFAGPGMPPVMTP